MPERCFEFLQGPITETRPTKLRQLASGLRETLPYKCREVRGRQANEDKGAGGGGRGISESE